jgi:alkylhydroperoxidase/carboxymuconolactone decarboxylase family protein YurZ
MAGTASASQIEQLKERFLAEVGIWPAEFDHLARLDPEFAEACLEFSAVPRRYGALDPKVRDFVHVALEVAVTHMHPERARAHIASAFSHGATVTELVDVCELVTLLGVHAMTMAAPILAEELAAAGQPVPPSHAGEREDLRKRYVADRGTFPPPLEPVLALHPEFIDAYRRLSAIPVRRGNLDPKTVELIIIALDASTTHLEAMGLRGHIHRALSLGASAAEILEVLELTCEQGIHGTELGVRLVAEEHARLTSAAEESS